MPPWSVPLLARDHLRLALGAATTVTWAMSGASSFIAKVMGLCFDMDKMVGKSFEDGLAQLKALAEKQG